MGGSSSESSGMSIDMTRSLGCGDACISVTAYVFVVPRCLCAHLNMRQYEHQSSLSRNLVNGVIWEEARALGHRVVCGLTDFNACMWYDSSYVGHLYSWTVYCLTKHCTGRCGRPAVSAISCCAGGVQRLVRERIKKTRYIGLTESYTGRRGCPAKCTVRYCARHMTAK